MNQVLKSIFSEEFNCDKKHILNVDSKMIITEDLLRELEQGITSEALNKIPSTVFKYHTQITIHGIFQKEINPYQYKLCFRNKNGSLGVKWLAIDFQKKLRIRSRVSSFSFHYNSTENYFYQSAIIQNESDIEQAVKKYQEIINKVDKSLFIGSFQILLVKIPYTGNFCDLRLSIHAIPEENIDKLVYQLGGITEEQLKLNEELKEQEREQERKEREERGRIAKEKAQELLKDFGIENFRKRSENETGLFFRPCLSDGVLKFNLYEITKEKRTLKYRESVKPETFDKVKSVELYSFYQKLNTSKTFYCFN